MSVSLVKSLLPLSSSSADPPPTLTDLIQQYPIFCSLSSYLDSVDLLSLCGVSSNCREVITDCPLSWKIIELDRDGEGRGRAKHALSVVLEEDVIANQVEELAIFGIQQEQELLVKILAKCKNLRYLVLDEQNGKDTMLMVGCILANRYLGNAQNLECIGLLQSADFDRIHDTDDFETKFGHMTQALHKVHITTDAEPCWRLPKARQTNWKLSNKELKVCRECSTELQSCRYCPQHRGECGVCERFWCMNCYHRFLGDHTYACSHEDYSCIDCQRQERCRRCL